MKNFHRLVLLLLPVLFFVHCGKNQGEPIIDEDIDITEFHFSAELNPSLLHDVALVKAGESYMTSLPKYGTKELIATFSTNAVKVLVNEVEQESAVSVNDFSEEVTYSLIGEKGGRKDIKVKIAWVNFDVPQITITTENGEDVTSKDNYLTATVSIDGRGRYSNFSGSTEIKGRGNSTWSYPKKPYRLKLTTKSEILGMPSAKNWVLLANYLDPSLMCNSVAMRIGRDLGVPFANTTIPVDLILNGEYKGSYVLTQQIEVHENRVNIGDDGYLLELDTYFDEDYKFYSAGYDLPVMIKNPELDDQSEIAPIRADFELLEGLIKDQTFPNNDYHNYFDIDVFAKYILVYFMTGNEEINHPKSTYMHKQTGGKFRFGPLWDFDWAYGYEEAGSHFTNPSRPMFWNTNAKGTVFFKRLFEDPAVRTAFKNHWTNYKQQHLAKLLTYIDEYARLIKASKERDEAKWNKGKDFDEEVTKMKNYIQNRAGYIDTYVASF